MATRVPETGTEHPVLSYEPAPPGFDRPVDADDAALEAVAAKRLRVALGLTGAMLVVYFGFIMLIAEFVPGEPNSVAIAFFLVFVAVALGIAWWAARRTRTTDQYYAAGHNVTGFQNGLALAGDYMSAASFLGIAGLVALKGYDGLIYSIGFLVGWPIVLFLIAEPLRNLGKYTFADAVAYRLKQT